MNKLEGLEAGKRRFVSFLIHLTKKSYQLVAFMFSKNNIFILQNLLMKFQEAFVLPPQIPWEVD
jgi:hypothetical protein